MFYTDGESDKPIEAIDKFRNLTQDYRNKIQFIAISENKTESLKETVEELDAHLKSTELRENVKTEDLIKELPEIANKFLNGHNNETESIQANNKSITLNKEEFDKYKEYLLESNISDEVFH